MKEVVDTFVVDIFAPVRDHQEIKFDGRYVHARGKLDWTMKFTKMEVARKVYKNIDECIARGDVWIEAIPTWEEYKHTGGKEGGRQV